MKVYDVVKHEITPGDIITYPVRKASDLMVKLAQVYEVREDGLLRVRALDLWVYHHMRDHEYFKKHMIYNTTVSPSRATWVDPNQLNEDLYFALASDPVHESE